MSEKALLIKGNCSSVCQVNEKNRESMCEFVSMKKIGDRTLENILNGIKRLPRLHDLNLDFFK